MGISESDLPGIGRRYEFTLRDRDRLVAVVHHGGQRDLYALRPGAMEPHASVQLDEDAAHHLGAIVAGRYYRPHDVDPVSTAIDRYSLGASEIAEASPLAGRSLLELDLRRSTGVSVVAIIAGRATRIDPPPATVIEVGDTVVVVGRRDSLDGFAASAAGRTDELGAGT